MCSYVISLCIRSLVSMLAISYLSKAAMTFRNLLLCSYGLETCNFYKGSMRIYKGSMKTYKGSMSLFRILVWTNEITVFVTTRI